MSIACPTEGAMIRYTTDGSDPTAESPVYRRFKISGKTTVRAVAERDGLLSEVVVAEYALGKCTDPVISLADGTVFEHSDQAVSIQWNEDGVLRYTLDGSDPTAESPVYGGPFTLSESTVVKAKVFSDSFFDSSIETARLTRVLLNAATPQIKAVSSFIGSKAEVTLSCATDGALILYTLNGNEPNSHSTKYTGPFYVNKSCTVKAYAVAADYLNSGVATFSIEKVWGIGDAMGDPDQTITTGGNLPFFHVSDATAPNGEAMRSGQITHNQISTLTTTVKGPGTVTFSWRSSCEADPEGIYEWDHAAFSVDGVAVLKLDGENTWREETVEITGPGSHTLVWSYIKDDVESEGEDTVWVAGWKWPSVYVDPIPEVEGEGDVATALAGSVDARLETYITTAAEYNAFRAWVDAKGIDHTAMKNSPHAWLSYALDTDGLIEKRFSGGDLSLISFKPTGDGTYALVADVAGVVIGANAAGANLARVFSVEGASTLEEAAFSPDAVDATLGVTADGKLSVNIVPRAADKTLFIRVRMCLTDEESQGDPSVTAVTVTFDANGGSGGTMRTVMAGSRIGELPLVSREGYDFANWWTAVSGGTQVNAMTVAKADVTYYVHWAVKSYTVTFDANGGSGGITVTKTYGSTLGILPIPEFVGYTFDGWFTAANGGTQVSEATVVTADVTYYAHWTIKNYVVTFDANGGSGGTTAIRTHGTLLGTLPPPVREGYTFDGWFTAVSGGTQVTSSIAVTTDVTYYAHWTIKNYTVTFDANGGSGGTTTTRTHGTLLGTLPTPTREGYTFDGWFTAANGGTQVSEATMMTADVTYYAHWTVKSYAVTFDANGGDGDMTVTRTHGSTLGSLPIPTLEGYTFDGWFTAANGGIQVTTTTAVTADVTYYAHWTIKNYTVTFDANGGSGGTMVTRTHGTLLGTLPTPTREGYTFDGWFTAANGGTQVSDTMVVTADVTYYAHWTIKNY
ncbi:MAG: InlB B-repeat-containing protein, partial [Kiritimatiellae bacterium]|nr:InlB B-repeat-containing protein [Kiritimatiellia bacterium]